MAKLDRLGWADGLTLLTYGLRIGVRTNEPRALERLPAYLPPGWRPTSSRHVQLLYSLIVGGETRPGLRRFSLLYADAARLVRTADPDEVFEALESHLQLVVAEHARRRVFVHAGVVGWRGQAIVIPGRSGSGKTSLVAALVRAGATYLSDEYAVLDARGRVQPYAGALSLKDGPGARPRKIPAEALGVAVGRTPLPVGLVVVTEYRPGVRWRPRRLSSGQALLALLAHSVPARSRPDVVLPTLQRALARATSLKGKRGEAAEAVVPLLKQLEASAR
jgi:hypothetical protein